MNHRFRIKLFLTMIMFAILISFAVSIIDYFRLKDQTIQQNSHQLAQIEELVKNSLETIDKAYYLFDQETAVQMRQYSEYLLDLYEQNPNFETWDFNRLQEELGMDIYIINQQNVIAHSSVISDIGLDFNRCCTTLARLLDERRATGEFYHDGIDLEQSTGEIKKYSYMATKDKQYMIELGYALEEDIIFKEFNFKNVINEIVDSYDSINDIHILNIGGLLLGEPAVGLSEERREAFERTRETKQTTEMKGLWNGEPATYRYVYFTSDYDLGITKNKVLEIIYNEHELQSVLSQNKQDFIMQLMIVLCITIILSFVISKWMARPIYLAFHDNLTGLKNRAAFEDYLNKHLQTHQGSVALIMLDLDHFKLVNDYYGHCKGDELLKLVAKTMARAVPKDIEAFRLGGDEFAIIMPNADQVTVEKTAINVLEALEESVNRVHGFKNLNITTSMGIAFAPDHGTDVKTLYRHADIALYQSKEKGKNQYQIFNPKSCYEH